MKLPSLRIAYLGQMADVATENGISKKIGTQAKAWRAAGHAVRYFALTPTHEAWPGLAPLETTLIARGSPLVRAWRSLHLARLIRAWKPDVIYFRYAHHSPGLPGLFRAVPTVAEINSDDQTEYPLTLSPLKLAYHRATRAKVLQAAAAFVPVTRELATRFASFGKPTEVIANSIDLADFSLAPLPAVASSLVFVGSRGTPWHGLERLGEIATLLPQVAIDVIGCGAADWPGPAPAPATMRFHGELTREHYAPLVARATAAIGTLGLFQKKMEEACPLKVREYFAMGLPVIAAYEDTDVPPNADYFLRLPNNREPLLKFREQMVAWLESWRQRRVARAAIAHLDTRVKEERRLAFLSAIAARRPPP